MYYALHVCMYVACIYYYIYMYECMNTIVVSYNAETVYVRGFRVLLAG